MGLGRHRALTQDWRDQLKLALDRAEVLEKEVKSGRKAVIEQLNNDQVIYARRAKLIALEQKYRSNAIKLSLFYRQADGMPIVVSENRLPERFPQPTALNDGTIMQQLDYAVKCRPEIQQIQLQRARTMVDLEYARNQLLRNLIPVLRSRKMLAERPKVVTKAEPKLKQV